MVLAKRSLKVERLGIALSFSLVLLILGEVWAQVDWKKDWEETLEAANKEARLTLYLSRGPNWDAVFADFRKEYPKLRLVLVTGTAPQINSRLLAERRAGKNLADVVGESPGSAFHSLHKAGALAPIKPLLILPEVLDQSKWFEGRHRFGDPENSYVFVYIGAGSALKISYNSKLVNPKEFTSYRDLLNPRWRGKLLSRDPRTSHGIMQFFFYNSMLGPEFLKHLYREMDITLSRDLRQMIDWLAVGKFAVAVGTRDIKKAKAQGLPVDDFDKRHWKEGVVLSALGGSMSLTHGAPHPHAAKVFINWFLSRRGQTAFQELSDPEDPPNSLRMDIPKDGIPIENRIFEGMRYMDLTKEQDFDMTPVSELIDEIMKKR